MHTILFAPATPANSAPCGGPHQEPAHQRRRPPAEPAHDPPHIHDPIDCPRCRRDWWRNVALAIVNRSRIAQGLPLLIETPSYNGGGA